MSNNPTSVYLEKSIGGGTLAPQNPSVFGYAVPQRSASPAIRSCQTASHSLWSRTIRDAVSDRSGQSPRRPDRCSADTAVTGTNCSFSSVPPHETRTAIVKTVAIRLASVCILDMFLEQDHKLPRGPMRFKHWVLLNIFSHASTAPIMLASASAPIGKCARGNTIRIVDARTHGCSVRSKESLSNDDVFRRS